MTKERQNIVIAEFCGWKDIQTSKFGILTGVPDTDSGLHHTIPNYTGSIDAMHEAEKKLNDEQGLQFVSEIEDICQLDLVRKKDDYTWLRFAVCHATAAQRAEALIKTIGRWEGE